MLTERCHCVRAVAQQQHTVLVPQLIDLNGLQWNLLVLDELRRGLLLREQIGDNTLEFILEPFGELFWVLFKVTHRIRIADHSGTE